MMITIANNHRAAREIVKSAAGHLRIMTRRMLDDGARFDDMDIAIVFADNSYALHGVVDGVLEGVLRLVRVDLRPGVCVVCGRIEPCRHSNRS